MDSVIREHNSSFNTTAALVYSLSVHRFAALCIEVGWSLLSFGSFYPCGERYQLWNHLKPSFLKHTFHLGRFQPIPPRAWLILLPLVLLLGGSILSLFSSSSRDTKEERPCSFPQTKRTHTCGINTVLCNPELKVRLAQKLSWGEIECYLTTALTPSGIPFFHPRPQTCQFSPSLVAVCIVETGLFYFFFFLFLLFLPLGENPL